MWGIPQNKTVPRVSAIERASTRQRLIEAGKAEFAVRGLARSRFDEISLAAGHAKGTIYNYFPDKETLFFAVVEAWCRQLVEGFVHDVDRGAAGDLIEIARLDAEIARKDPDLARVVINQLPALASDQRPALLAAIEPGIGLLTDVIATGQAQGEIDERFPATTLARLFLATLSAIEQEALDQASELTLDDVVPLVERTQLAGLRR